MRRINLFVSSLSAVDEEFEAVATQVLKRTQAMVNKYRRLLMVEAEVRPLLTSQRLHAFMRAVMKSTSLTGCPSLSL